MKKEFIISSIIVIVVIIFVAMTQERSIVYNQGVVTIRDKRIRVEVADTKELRMLGLSGRQKLDHNKGMLFIFDGAGIYPFWMKGMHIPLDILWIQDGRIVEIWENAPIPENSNIPRYAPSNEGNMVLEVNAGYVKKHNIKVDDSVIIDIMSQN